MEGPQIKADPLPRPSVSLTDLRLRTPIVDNLLSMLPMGHDKALKYALYNVLALVVASAVIVAFWGVYCILEPFIKSLMWALLCGSVLHPFKERLCNFARTWLKASKKSTTPFTIRVLTSPFKIVDNFSDSIGLYVFTFWKSILSAVIVFFVTYIAYHNPPVTLALGIQVVVTTCFGILISILNWVNGHLVLALNVIYLVTIFQSIISGNPSKSEQTTNANPVNQPKEEVIPPMEATDSLDITDRNSLMLKSMSYITWIVTFAYFCRLLPYPLLVALILFVIVGAVAYIRGRSKSLKYSLPTISRYACLMVLNIGSGNSLGLNTPNRFGTPGMKYNMTPLISTLSTSGKLERQKLAVQRSLSVGANSYEMKFPIPDSSQTAEDDEGNVEHTDSNASLSDQNFSHSSEDDVDGLLMIESKKFMYGVFCACFVVQVWNRLWLFHLIPIPIAYYGVKRISSYFGISLIDYIQSRMLNPFIEFYNDTKGPSGSLFPEPVRVGLRIMYMADRKLVGICESCLDPVASSLILVFVVMATVLGIIFASIQVYAEGDHLIRVGVNLVNSTVSQHPEINNVLPEGWQGIMGSMVGNAYIWGREYITNVIRDTVAEKNPEKAEQIEEQVIELWDRIYLAWNQTWDNAKDAEKVLNGGNYEEAVGGSGLNPQNGWDDILESGKKMPHLLELSVLANYAKANVGLLWSVVESLWNILIGNISLAISAITAILSVLFGGGTAILNLIINLVVFFTSLFYLLSASTSVYKPVELFNTWAPGTSGVHTSNFVIAVEEAINGVFMASFKMAAFYGMWTWLIHTLFQVNIVFVPSIFAALFAAVPFLMPYWAAFPAVLELWLIQGHWSKALLMLLAQMAPMSVVDTQIYSEIKGGGHPYLTGLAVAGGIFCFGVQGAIMGPVVLCCVFVAVKIGSHFLKESVEPEMLHRSPHFGRRPNALQEDDHSAETNSFFS